MNIILFSIKVELVSPCSFESFIKETNLTLRCPTPDMISYMPDNDRKGSEILFFKPDLPRDDDAIERGYERFNLLPCHPVFLAKANIDDPKFATHHHNATHYQDAEGRWCCIGFKCDSFGRLVCFVHRNAKPWHESFWAAGVPKE